MKAPSVVIAESMPRRGDCAARSIRDAGGDAVFVQTDVSDEAQVKSMVRQALDRSADRCLVHNAAVLLGPDEARAHELTNETWDSNTLMK